MNALGGTIPGVSPQDRLSFFIGVGAIVVTSGVGTCSTNARFDDVNRRLDGVNARLDDMNRRFDDLNGRLTTFRPTSASCGRSSSTPSKNGDADD